MEVYRTPYRPLWGFFFFANTSRTIVPMNTTLVNHASPKRFCKSTLGQSKSMTTASIHPCPTPRSSSLDLLTEFKLSQQETPNRPPLNPDV